MSFIQPRQTTGERYEQELIQVAASAIAAVVDSRMQRQEQWNEAEGIADNRTPEIKLLMTQNQVISEVRHERALQDIKFKQVMPIRQDPLVWLAVMAEELAEVAEEILPNRTED